jgi:hypothetical protein
MLRPLLPSASLIIRQLEVPAFALTERRARSERSLVGLIVTTRSGLHAETAAPTPPNGWVGRHDP